MMTEARGARRAYAAKTAVSNLLWMAILPATAQAALLQIDPSTSSIRYVRTVVVCYPDSSGETICPEPDTPKTYPVSGQIELEESPWGDPQLKMEKIGLTAVELESAALEQGFLLNPLEGILEEGHFWANDSGCAVVEGPGSWFCQISVPATGALGRWDGRTLVMTGSRLDLFDRFDFSITAFASSVPEPGTLLLSLTLLPFVARQSRPWASTRST
jgi:hypothetical protein